MLDIDERFMILEENYVHQCTQTSKYPYWYSLVQCEDCGRLNIILRKQGKHGCGVKYCRSCYQKGERGPGYGRQWSEKSRKLLSIRSTGRIYTEEWKKNISLGKMGHKDSEATRYKKSLARIGSKNPQYGKRGELSTMWGRRGLLSPNYNPNLTEHDRRNYRQVEISTWRRSVMERDHFTCQITGRKGGKLVAHHLDSWNAFPDKRLDINNGITINKALHDLFHQIYGKGTNTYHQFYDFAMKFARIS